MTWCLASQTRLVGLLGVLLCFRCRFGQVAKNKIHVLFLAFVTLLADTRIASRQLVCFRWLVVNHWRLRVC